MIAHLPVSQQLLAAYALEAHYAAKRSQLMAHDGGVSEPPALGKPDSAESGDAAVVHRDV